MNERLCEKSREELLDLLEERGPGVLPGALSRHVAACASCRRLYETARQLADGLTEADLYGPQLKRRTLAALEAFETQPGWVRLVAPASLLSFSVWFLAPWLIVARVIGFWLPGTLVPLMVSASLMSAVGLIIALFVFAFVHANKEAWKRGGVTRTTPEVRHV